MACVIRLTSSAPVSYTHLFSDENPFFPSFCPFGTQVHPAAQEGERFCGGRKAHPEFHFRPTGLHQWEAVHILHRGRLKLHRAQTGAHQLHAVSGGKLITQGEHLSLIHICVCGKEAVAKGIKAGDIIKKVTSLCGGKGGGKPDSAMGGGSDVLKLDNALATVDDFVHEKLGL